MERPSAAISKQVVLVTVCLVSFTTALLSTTVNIALPSIGRDLVIPAVTLGWVVNGWVLATAMSLVPAGRLADIFGRRKLFFFGMLLFGISSAVCAFANSSLILISMRVVQGFSSGMTISTSIPILTSSFPVEERGRVLGINVAAVYFGLSLGPFAGGMLTQSLGWRSIFFLNACLSTLVLILIFWKMRWDRSEYKPAKFDLKGTIAYSLSLLLILYGFSILPSATGIIPIVLGALIAALFVWWESRQTSPLLNLALFKANPVFVFSNLATLCNYCATTAVGFLLSFYLQYNKGFSPQDAGLILLIQPVVMALFSPSVGKFSDRANPQILAAVGMLLNAVSLGLFAMLTAETSLWFIGLSLAIFGMGMGFFVSPNQNAIVGSVDKKVLGTATGVLATARYVGMSLSMAVAMIFFSIYIGDTQITPEYYPAFLVSTKIMFVIFAALSVFGGLAQLKGFRNRNITKTA